MDILVWDMPDTMASVRLMLTLMLTLLARSPMDFLLLTPMLPAILTMSEQSLVPHTLPPPIPDMLVLDILVMLDILAMLVSDTLVLAIPVWDMLVTTTNVRLMLTLRLTLSARSPMVFLSLTLMPPAILTMSE